MRAIQKMLTLDSRQRRYGNAQPLPAEHLVPGDLVLLEAGDRVPVNLRRLQSRDLRLEEAALTDEFLPVNKQPEPVAEQARLGYRSCMA